MFHFDKKSRKNRSDCNGFDLKVTTGFPSIEQRNFRWKGILKILFVENVMCMSIKFRFSEKATTIWLICGLLRKPELVIKYTRVKVSVDYILSVIDLLWFHETFLIFSQSLGLKRRRLSLHHWNIQLQKIRGPIVPHLQFRFVLKRLIIFWDETEKTICQPNTPKLSQLKTGFAVNLCFRKIY